ncbi:MAG: FAD/NAD(P)-binding protein [Halanaerobiales bacterium]|nr:FAD/NAD(P)-binding protein [Halanaerobiales bacterium]
MVKTNMLPQKAEIVDIKQETETNLNIKTFRYKFLDDQFREKFSFKPGQFMMVTVYGVGEAPFGFASSPTEKDYIEFSVKKVGLVTEALHNLKIGDKIGLRGPFGNGFPVESIQNKNIIFIGGGIGLAPLRSLINYVLDQQNRSKYKNIQLLNAFRSPEDTLYCYDYKWWENTENTKVKYTIDEPCEGWSKCVGYPHNLIDEELDWELPDTKFFTCGPPVMIKFVTDRLKNLGIKPADIITTLEMRMSCGVGKCGRCNIGHYYVCKDGPVFTLEQLVEMPDEY